MAIIEDQLLRIKNGSISAMVAGVEKTAPLPVITINTIVKVWTVPDHYRANGLFVSASERGEPEEIPACDLSACELLGELDTGSYVAEMEALKAAKRKDINEACNTAVADLAKEYPEREIQSWPQQVKEAEALLADPQAHTPLLTAISDARGLPVVELTARVLANMNAFACAAGEIFGRRQAAEDRIAAATTKEELMTVSL